MDPQSASFQLSNKFLGIMSSIPNPTPKPKTAAPNTQGVTAADFSNANSTTPTAPKMLPFTASGPFQNLAKQLGTITTQWGNSTRYEKFHPGIDIANKIGTPIPAFAGGTVTNIITGKVHGQKGYGNQVEVTDSQGNKHRYSHLNQVLVTPGEKITPGEELATMGASGSTYSSSGTGLGSHLDYRIVNTYNKYVNPYTYFTQNLKTS